MDFWTFLVFLHGVSWAYFLGGQIMLAANVVPVMLRQGKESPEQQERSRESIRQVARTFGVGTLIALGMLILTGIMLASHFSYLWDLGAFHVKLALVVATFISVLIHLTRGESRAWMGITFLLTLATVYAGINLMH